MSDLTQCSVKDIVGIKRGYAFRSEDYRTEGTPILRVTNIEESGQINNEYIFLDADLSEHYESYHVEDGDVLLVMVGATTGKLGFVKSSNVPALLNQNIWNLKPTDKIDKGYLKYKSAEIIDQYLAVAQGSARDFLKQGDFEKFEVTIHKCFGQQKKIANILSTVDKLIENTQTLIGKYTAIKQGMMADLFTRGIDLSPGPDGTPASNPNYGQLRPSFETAPELYQQTELGWVPKDWEVSNLGDCCEVHNNRRKPISAEEREKIKGDFPYYGCTGVLDYIDEFRLDGKYVIIGEDGDHFLKFARQEMTILIDGKFNVNNHAHVVAGTEQCLTEWFHLYFVHRDITFFLTRQGAGRFKLKKETLLELPMLLPSIVEQQEIYSRYLAINEKQNKERATLLKYQKIKKGLMQDLLTGKVTVK
jgi:restriction endonuclease S subunit